LPFRRTRFASPNLKKFFAIARARFGRHTRENVLEKRDRDRRGLAGLAAGVALAESGWRVKLFELRPYLGGRATSYVLPSGEHVDNCQHVTLGCCTNLDDFYRRVGSANKVKFFDRLFFLDPQGRSGAMQAGILPAPFHMTGSFATFAPLSLGDKLSIARAMMRNLVHRRKTEGSRHARWNLHARLAQKPEADFACNRAILARRPCQRAR